MRAVFCREMLMDRPEESGHRSRAACVRDGCTVAGWSLKWKLGMARCPEMEFRIRRREETV